MGPLRSLGNANKRKPGVLQTIDLLAHVNPSGANTDAELDLLALAGLHHLISQGSLVSSEAYDVVADIIERLGIDEHPGGWGTRTLLTLPAQERLPSKAERQTDIKETGHAIGKQVKEHLEAFVPAEISFREIRDAYAKPLRDVARFLSDLKEPIVQAGRLRWRMMSRDKMRGLVWEESLTNLGAAYGVSANAVKKFCSQNEIDLPPAGYWRMTPAARDGLLRLIAIVDPEKLARQVWFKPAPDLGRELKVPAQSIRDYCRLKNIDHPSASYWRMTPSDRVAVRQALNIS